MCWPGARLETLCSWKEREQKPKEGGKGSEGEEKKRKAGRREGERRWGSEEVRGSGQRSWSQSRPARKQTNLGLQVRSLQVLLLGCWRHAALGGPDGGPPVLSGQEISLRGPASPLPSSVLLLGEVRLRWTSGKPSEFGKVSYNMAAEVEGDGQAVPGCARWAWRGW